MASELCQVTEGQPSVLGSHLDFQMHCPVTQEPPGLHGHVRLLSPRVGDAWLSTLGVVFLFTMVLQEAQLCAVFAVC